MRYFTNHCWCSDSIHGGGYFDCRFIVTIEEKAPSDVEDWPLLIDEVDFVSKKNYEFNKEFYTKQAWEITEEQLTKISTRKSNTLKPHVVKWLEENVKDRAGEGINKGWTIGSNEYNYCSLIALDVFFHRRSDALRFIKEFSRYKKPSYYHDYFRDKRKSLNLSTGKYDIIQNGREE